MVDLEICPWCGTRGVDITTSTDEVKRYLCIGPEGHEWRQGEDPAAEAIEPERDGFLRRLLNKFSLRTRTPRDIGESNI